MKNIHDFMYTPTEIQLAHEIAERLNDPAALSQWLKYAQSVSHEFLREQLNKVCSMPDRKITSSRAGLFVHIITNHLRYGNGHSRD